MNDHYKNMSSGYKEQKTHIHDNETRMAYVGARLPATYAVVRAVIDRLFQEQDISFPQTVLDLGSGPGTCMLVLEDYLDAPIQTTLQGTLVERDPGFIEIAKNLLKNPHTYICSDIKKYSYTPHDWVMASYSLNEIVEKEAFIQNAFNATKKIFILIEPGTPQGFQNILTARDIIHQSGGHILLPCPHSLTCPSQWCHFSQRLPRTKLHKSIKSASLGYEDEKYTYLVASKSENTIPNSRIVSTPQKHSGHLEITLCTSNGTLETKTFTKSKCPDFKEIKKKEWGDDFNFGSETL
jgi:ribosomal protein RSM22 (predicted rRNA methylase)